MLHGLFSPRRFVNPKELHGPLEHSSNDPNGCSDDSNGSNNDRNSESPEKSILGKTSTIRSALPEDDDVSMVGSGDELEPELSDKGEKNKPCQRIDFNSHLLPAHGKLPTPSPSSSCLSKNVAGGQTKETNSQDAPSELSIKQNGKAKATPTVESNPPQGGLNDEGGSMDIEPTDGSSGLSKPVEEGSPTDADNPEGDEEDDPMEEAKSKDALSDLAIQQNENPNTTTDVESDPPLGSSRDEGGPMNVEPPDSSSGLINDVEKGDPMDVEQSKNPLPVSESMAVDKGAPTGVVDPMATLKAFGESNSGIRIIQPPEVTRNSGNSKGTESGDISMDFDIPPELRRSARNATGKDKQSHKFTRPHKFSSARKKPSAPKKDGVYLQVRMRIIFLHIT